MIFSRILGASSMRILRVASVLVLVALALMCWGVLHPRPLPVIVAMSIGQVIGTAGALLFMFVVLRDLRLRLRKPPASPASPAPADGPAEPTVSP